MHNLITTGYKKELKPLKKTTGIRIRKMMIIFIESPIPFHTAALTLVEDEKWGPFPPAAPSDRLTITLHSSSASILTS